MARYGRAGGGFGFLSCGAVRRSDFFCFQCDARAPVQLYDVSLTEQRPALTFRAAFAGEAEMESF